MLAAVFEGEGKMSLLDLPVPKVERGSDVLIEVEACGVCGTDLHILAVPPRFKATTGVVLGHEYVGRVVEAGEEVRGFFSVGERVIVNPDVPCGLCAFCRMGLPTQCTNIRYYGVNFDGGFARYSLLPAAALHRISTDVPLASATLAEPLADVLNGVGKLSFQVGDDVAIFGGGPIGTLFAKVLRACGAGKIIVFEKSEYRRNFIRSLGVCDLVVEPGGPDTREIVYENTRAGADVVIDAVGNLFAEACEAAKRGGRVLLLGLDEKHRSTLRQYDITTRELTVLGSWIAHDTFDRAVRLLESGVIDLSGLITRRLPLDQIETGMELLRSQKAMKVIIDRL